MFFKRLRNKVLQIIPVALPLMFETAIITQLMFALMWYMCGRGTGYLAKTPPTRRVDYVTISHTDTR